VEKSQANHILIVVEVAPILEDGKKELSPTRSVQVTVPNLPIPIRAAADGPEQLPRFKRLSSSAI
jgi:hypothetical protein